MGFCITAILIAVSVFVFVWEWVFQGPDPFRRFGFRIWVDFGSGDFGSKGFDFVLQNSDLRFNSKATGFRSHLGSSFAAIRFSFRFASWLFCNAVQTGIDCMAGSDV